MKGKFYKSRDVQEDINAVSLFKESFAGIMDDCINTGVCDQEIVLDLKCENILGNCVGVE